MNGCLLRLVAFLPGLFLLLRDLCLFRFALRQRFFRGFLLRRFRLNLGRDVAELLDGIGEFINQLNAVPERLAFLVAISFVGERRFRSVQPFLGVLAAGRCLI